jgi:hypothetical protein
MVKLTIWKISTKPFLSEVAGGTCDFSGAFSAAMPLAVKEEHISLL